MTTHDLKTWPEPFVAVLDGSKTFEIRVDDRGYKIGDRLRLREWDPRWLSETAVFSDEVRTVTTIPPYYTGREILVEVTYLSPGGSWGLPSTLCVMAIRKVEPT